MSTPDTTHGVTIAMASLTLPTTMMNFEWDGPEREMYKSQNLSAAANGTTKVPDPQYDPGTITMEFEFDPDGTAATSMGALLMAAMEDLTARAITITWPTGTTVINGFVKKWRVRGPRGIMTGELVIELSGNITW